MALSGAWSWALAKLGQAANGGAGVDGHGGVQGHGVDDDHRDGDKGKQWYFNTVTEQPELGPKSPIEQRMGPYRTREDALDAWKIVQERNLKWEEQDRQWNRWSKDGGDGDGETGRKVGKGTQGN